MSLFHYLNNRLNNRLSARLGSILLLGVNAGAGASAIALLAMAESSVAACEFFSVPQSYNTSTRFDESGEVIVIGHQPERPYRVVVVSPDGEMPSNEALGEIRECVLDAFATRSGLGNYIQVASFDRRGDAEVIGRVLRQSGYSSRVVYGQ